MRIPSETIEEGGHDTSRSDCETTRGERKAKTGRRNNSTKLKPKSGTIDTGGGTKEEETLIVVSSISG